jgi:hypothetical protein
MSDALYIVDIIGSIVDDLRADYTPPAGYPVDSPYYMYGHPLEIVNLLSTKEKSGTLKFKKYPLIALFQDFEEQKGSNQSINSDVNLNIVIAVNTLREYTSEQRYTATFKTVLYPIYNLLITKLKASNYFAAGTIPHTKIDRVFWGKTGLYGNDSNIFNDYIDAIEIQNLQLSVYNNVKIC